MGWLFWLRNLIWVLAILWICSTLLGLFNSSENASTAIEKRDLTSGNDCLPAVTIDSDLLVDRPEPRCAAVLPPRAAASASALISRAEELLEGDASIFPFSGEVGYAIGDKDLRAVEQSNRARVEKGDKPAGCAFSTYDGHSVAQLAALFLPGGSGAVSLQDEVIDLGAGIGKVLAVVALTSNASARGIELSSERYEVGCKVLRLLEQVYASDSLLAARESSGTICPASRRFELWRGDLFDPPANILREPIRGGGNRGGSLTFFAYSNCYSYGLIRQMMRLVAGVKHPCVRLLTTKEPVSIDKVQEGLRRIRGSLYTLYARDGDKCRADAAHQTSHVES